MHVAALQRSSPQFLLVSSPLWRLALAGGCLPAAGSTGKGLTRCQRDGGVGQKAENSPGWPARMDFQCFSKRQTDSGLLFFYTQQRVSLSCQL